MNAEKIYEIGLNLPIDFISYEKIFNALIKADITGEWIYLAGKHWKQFDYEKGLDELIKKNKDGGFICSAGRYWKQFNYEKGFNALIDAGAIYLAGKYWKIFDYEKGFNALIKKDKNGYWIYQAGNCWMLFNFDKATDALIKIDKEGKYIFLSRTHWKRNTKENKRKLKIAAILLNAVSQDTKNTEMYKVVRLTKNLKEMKKQNIIN